MKMTTPTLGPIQHVPFRPRRYHLSLLALLLALFAITALTLYIINTQLAPLKAQAQCLEINHLFTTSHWLWNEDTKICELSDRQDN